MDPPVWRGDRWRVNPTSVQKLGIHDGRERGPARSERKEGSAMKKLLERVAQTYRIPFAPAPKGVYVWVPEAETSQYVPESLGWTGVAAHDLAAHTDRAN